MRTMRAVAVLLLLALASGPALLDRCLISCHDDVASASAVAPCHEHPASSDGSSRIQGVDRCGHDHDSLEADRVGDIRVRATVHFAPVALTPVLEGLASLVRLRACLGAADVAPGHQRIPLDLPLRV